MSMWSKRSQIKVKGHLRSTCTITWKCKFGLICILKDQLELPLQVWDQGQMLTSIIHRPRRQAILAVRGPRCIFCLRGYCTSGPYFWRLCAFSQKIKQLWTKYPMDLVRNVPRNSKITVLLQQRPLLWSYSEKCAKINIFHVLRHKSITTWVSEIPVQ